MLDVPPGNHGHEFYAVEDLEPLATVCASADWSQLRDGKLSVCHVVFPFCVHSLDILLLPEAISTAISAPVCQFPSDIETVVGIEGLWGVCITPQDFVTAIASVPPDHSADLLRTWMDIHIREHESECGLHLVIPDWTSTRMIVAIGDLVKLSRTAIERNLTVVDIWAL